MFFRPALYKKAFQEWQKDKVAMLSAALSYYTIFSIVPLLLIVIAIAGFFFGRSSVEHQLLLQLQSFLGSEASNTIRSALQHANNQKKSIISSIIGIVTLILGASGVFGQLKEALNMIWHVKATPKNGIVAFIRERFLSFSMVIVIGFLLLTSLVISTLLTVLSTYFQSMINAPLLLIINYFVSIGITTILFALVFKFLPDVKLRWRYVWSAAFITALLFTIGKEAISFYIGHTAPGSTYGAAGSLVIILLWVFYTSQIVLFGAELAKAVYLLKHEAISPAENAQLESAYQQARPTAYRHPLVDLIGYTLGTFLAVFFNDRAKKKTRWFPL